MPTIWSVAPLACAAVVLGGCIGGGGEDDAFPGSTVPSGSAITVVKGDPPGILAARETEPVPHDGDAADDPAIWIDPANPARTTILGTDKKGGIAVYDLAGREIQYRADGDINNVDLRLGFPLGGRRVALVTAGDRDDNRIMIYRVVPATRRLVAVAARTIHPGLSTYGSCMYHSPRSGRFYYFVTSKSGQVEQWALFDNGRGEVDARRVRRFSLSSQTEACVADDRLALLYLGEEDKGVWRLGAEPSAGGKRVLVDSTRAGGHLDADVEGVAIAYGPRATGYLLVSSQGDDSFVVYRRGGRNEYVTRFTVEAGDSIDGAENTDGMDLTTASLGPDFPRGLFVAQDGQNDSGNQNFKLVPWQRIPLP